MLSASGKVKKEYNVENCWSGNEYSEWWPPCHGHCKSLASQSASAYSHQLKENSSITYLRTRPGVHHHHYYLCNQHKAWWYLRWASFLCEEHNYGKKLKPNQYILYVQLAYPIPLLHDNKNFLDGITTPPRSQNAPYTITLMIPDIFLWPWFDKNT